MKFIAAALACLFFLTGIVVAGDWHVAGSLECRECHIQHGSSQREPGVQEAYPFLLRRGTINELCLSCHDGADPTAPDVSAPTPMYNSTPSEESAAGAFGMLGLANPNGHSIGIAVQTPLQQVPTQSVLTCVSCHAAHGNGNYRNLLTDPTGIGASLSLVLGTNVFVENRPDNPPTTAGSIAAYNRDNVGYVSGMTEWCSSCHDQLSTNSIAALPAHFNAHPSDIALNAYPNDDHTDPAHWIAGSGEGFSVIGQSVAMLRVPFLAAGATDFPTSRTATVNSRVSCLSCHKAHGSSYRKGMVWPYLEENDYALAGCQQCHNK